MGIDFYINNSYKVSELITRKYSTSFSLATALLKGKQRRAIYAVYGFVRLADEIVDSFHGYDKAFLLDKLSEDLDYALQNGISTNVVLTAFAHTVKEFSIDIKHIQAFKESMRWDLSRLEYTRSDDFNNYVYGSADVVGLMCLKVFCNGDQAAYEKLEYRAQKLGSAFQKVNFLRDLKHDINNLGRSYFPQISENTFDIKTKKAIERIIDDDFSEAIAGIRQLPGRSRLAVLLAYYYYMSLFKKIKRSSPEKVLSERLRISNARKYLIICKAMFLYKTKLV